MMVLGKMGHDGSYLHFDERGLEYSEVGGVPIQINMIARPTRPESL